MNRGILQIDVSDSKDNIEDDLVKVKLSEEDVVQLNFTKFFIRSKYLQDKYKYSDALDSIQYEILEIKKVNNMKSESIKTFIKLLEEEKIKLPIEIYKDIYKLCEYFILPKFIRKLQIIGEEKLFQDLDFSVQILKDSYSSNNNFESKIEEDIEKFLTNRINECIQNSKFKELPIQIIYRIIDKSREQIEHNLLVDFIIESIETRFILFKFIELHKLREDKIKEMIQFLDDEDSPNKQIYLEHIPFNLSFIKNLQTKYDQLFNEFNQNKQELNQTKQEFNQTKQECNQTKQELNQTKQELNQTKQELNQTKQEYNQTKQELNQTKQELNQTKQELNQIKQELNQIKQELNQIKQELNRAKQEFNQNKQELNYEKISHSQTKEELSRCKKELKGAKIELNRLENEKKLCTQSIIVGGNNKHNQLGKKSNNKNKDGKPVIYPPVLLTFDHSKLLSYSVYSWHSVLVMSDGSLKGVGYNSDGRISSTLQKTVIKDFTDFSIKDPSGRQLAAISAVCCAFGTLYMFSKSEGSGRQLVLCDSLINEGDPVFLDIGNHHPVSLFGGGYHSAAIGSEGEVIFINRDSVKNSPNSPIASVNLLDGEKASSVACCESSVVVLSSNGRVFSSPVDSNRVLKFSIVSELSDHEIVCVSGTYEHYLAVNKEGRVFGRGSNKNCKLGLGKETESVSSFTEILSLAGYKIRAAYAGSFHSLFETREGKILSCGYNFSGQLLLSNGPGEDVYLPTETTITGGSTLCISGNNLSAVFINISPPPSIPNMPMHQYY